MHIDIDEIAKSFGATAALHPVSLLGPLGSGKTTLLRILGGLEYPTSGRILFDGQDAATLSVQDRRAGFVFQSYALFRHMTAFENVAYGLKARSPRDGVRKGFHRRVMAPDRARSKGRDRARAAFARGAN